MCPYHAFFPDTFEQVLLAMNANVEDRGIKGDCTPLMEAASGGFVDIVQLLILHGADVNAQSSAGKIYVAHGQEFDFMAHPITSAPWAKMTMSEYACILYTVLC